ncbi:MAG: hypothetical protein JRH15_14595 [Deltaproteobacteria bacterium]|nr:hypothetical protein [Deltaproteobacteria bacterium]
MMQTKQYGWAGTILKVDLTQGEIEKIPTRQYQPEKFIGGVGLCSKIYWDMGCPGKDAFDPENPVMISVGPMTGIPGPFNRGEICGIGAQNYPRPQFTYSGFGGSFPSAMKYAGYDAIVVTGQSSKPVYIDINDDQIEIKNADHLWGLDLIETQKVIIEKDPKISTLAIGPAGENRVPNSIIANESGSTAGQGGFGAVMGSKNLKAIAVKGTGVVPIAKPDELFKVIELCKAKDTWSKGAAQLWGRSPLTGGEVEKEMVSKYRTNFAGPYGCPYQCMGFYKVPGGGSGAAICASWWYGGFNPEKSATKTVWKGNYLAQKLGINHFELLDLIMIIGETLEQGLMTIEDWEQKAGLPNLPDILGGSSTEDKFMEALLYDIASGKSLISQGTNRALDQLVKVLENGEEIKKIVDIKYPAWGYPQHYYGWLGLCLHVALDTRDSGDSTDGYLAFNRDNVSAIPTEVLGKHFEVPYGITTYAHAERGDEKAQWEGIEIQSKFEMTQQSLRNSLCICNFASLPDAYFHPEKNMDIKIFQSKVLSAATGVDFGVDDYWKAGERIWNLRRAINITVENRTREYDTYVDNFFDVVWDDVQDSGGSDGVEGNEEMRVYKAYIDREKFEALKDRYYQLAGWDIKTGWPTRQKLEELDMKNVADGLETMGRLP